MKRIRVALETQFAYGTRTGLGTYAFHLARALRARPDIELMEIFDAERDIWRFDRRVVWDQIIAPRRARRTKPDVTHFTGGTLALFPPHPCVLTLHDLAWSSGAVRGKFYQQAYFAGAQRALVRKADRIAADTATARDAIVELLAVDPARVAIAGAGVDDDWFSIQRDIHNPPYVLAVGTVEARKDLETAVRAVAQMADLTLVSAGPATPYAASVLRLAGELGISDRVEVRGYVDEPALRALYAGASALIFPSRYEGFGLPPLQALAARLPVVASDIPVVREVLGDCAFFAPPGDARAFADALRQALRDGTRQSLLDRGRMRARDFTWSAVAQRMVGLYRQLA